MTTLHLVGRKRANTSLLLAMVHEVRAECVPPLVARMTDKERDPYDDVRIVLRSLGVSRSRVERFIAFLERDVVEWAHREIARRYPDEELPATACCPDCDGSGVARYGYCERCDATGLVPLVEVA